MSESVRRRHPFTTIPVGLIRDSSLTPTAKLTWITLSTWAQWGAEEREARPAMKTVATHMGCSVSTVWRATRRLTDVGYLVIHSGKEAGVPNVYELIDDPAEEQGGIAPAREGVSRGRGRGVSRGRGTNKEEPVNESQLPIALRPLADAVAEPDLFERIWKHYPRKLAKASAKKAFDARVKCGVDPRMLGRATMNYAEACRGKDPAFVLHGATFFGPNERWRDYADGVPATAVSNGSGRRDPARRGATLVDAFTLAAGAEHRNGQLAIGHGG